MSETAIMLCGHGSRDEGAITEFAAIAARLRERVDVPLEHGFLEFATPIIRDGLDKLREAGAKRVLAVPGMLFAAGHAKNDIPSVLNTYMAQHDGMAIKSTAGISASTRKHAARRRRPGHGQPWRPPRRESGAAATRRCWSPSGAARPIPTPTPTSPRSAACCGKGSVSAGARSPIPASPSRWSQPGLEARGAPRLSSASWCFPYFLFTGILVRRIYDHTDIVAAEHPEVEFVKAGPT